MIGLCIGAGVEQCHSINKAKEMGHKVIAIDGNPNAPGLNISDVGIVQDIKDEESVIEIAKQYNIDYIIPTPIGRYLTTAGRVNDALELKGISYEGALNGVDKYRCLGKLREHSLGCAKQALCMNTEELEVAIKEIGIPCIVKPNKGAGSRGVIVLHRLPSSEEVQEYVKDQSGEEILVEEFIYGDEYGVDCIIKDGEIKFLFLRDKIMTELPYRQEIGYTAPTSLGKSMKEKIKLEIEKISEVLKIDNCCINADIIVNNHGDIYLVEIAGRPAGYNMSKFFIPYVTGIDIIEEAIKMMAGKECLQKTSESKVLVYKFFNLDTGIIDDVPHEIINGQDGIVDYENNLEVGQRIGIVRNGADIIYRGFVATTAESVDLGIDLADKVIGKFKVS